MSDRSRLAAARCVPRKGAEHKLSAERSGILLAALPGWSQIESDGAIEKTFKFKNYYETIAFVNALAWIAHLEDHHPDLGVHYDKAVVRFSTHDVGGLSENDFICAAKAEALLDDPA